jgi:hypothetical protein
VLAILVEALADLTEEATGIPAFGFGGDVLGG